MECYKIKLQTAWDNTIPSTKVKSPIDAVNFINNIEEYDKSTMENLVVIALNIKNDIIAYSEVGKGNINTCASDIPSIFRVLLKTMASKFILVHNHPSGDSTPSHEDLAVTNRIEEASKLMGFEFLDHIILGHDEYTSIFVELNKRGVK